MKIDHLVLQVSEFAEDIKFYRMLFEFVSFVEIVDPGSENTVGFQQKDGLTVWIAQADIEPIKPKMGTLDHFAFHCEDRAEVDSAFQFCESKKWDISSAPKAYPQYGNFYGFAILGPDEQKLEFVTR